MADKPVLADRAADVTVSAPELLADAYRTYQRFRLTLRGTGAAPAEQERDVLRSEKIVAVLPVDLARDEVVLISQFRLPGHLANGKGELIEIVAGGVEPGEQPIDAARRECREEIGVAPTAIVELFSFLTTPGITDEEITLFLAAVDARQVPARTSLGGEQIEVLRVPIDAAVAALNSATLRNGPLLLALQWLALNRARLPEMLNTAR